MVSNGAETKDTAVCVHQQQNFHPEIICTSCGMSCLDLVKVAFYPHKHGHTTVSAADQQRCQGSVPKTQSRHGGGYVLHRGHIYNHTSRGENVAIIEVHIQQSQGTPVVEAEGKGRRRWPPCLSNQNGRTDPAEEQITAATQPASSPCGAIFRPGRIGDGGQIHCFSVLPDDHGVEKWRFSKGTSSSSSWPDSLLLDVLLPLQIPPPIPPHWREAARSW